MQNNEQNQELAQDMQDKLSAIKALVTVHSLLGVGMFQLRNQEQLKESIKFIESLHKQIMEEALNHPDAVKVQELIDFKTNQEEKKD